MYPSLFAISALVASIYIGAAAGQNCGNDPVAELGLNPVEIIKHWNYTAEEHWVTSEDGYIIHMVRITGKKDVPSNCANKEPVIVHHGLLCTSADWLVMDAPKVQGGPGGLAFMLVDAGYDVWLPSARGSTLSLNHTSLKPDSVEFWQFSFNEMGKYDVPAIINKILEITGQDELSYIGHSQGCAMFQIAMHYHPELPVRKMVALAPAVYIGGSTSPVVLALTPAPQELVEAGFIAASNGAVIPTELTKLTNNYAAGVCASLGYLTTDVVCQNALYAIAGFPKDGKYNMDGCTVARVVSHTPATTSIRCVTHFVQNKQTKQFKPQCNNLENANPASIAVMDTLFSPGADAINQLGAFLNSFRPTGIAGRKKRGILGNVVGGLVDGLLGALPLTGTIQAANQIVNLDIKHIDDCEPEYNLSNTKMPVLVMCGDSDSLVVKKDCHTTASKLGGPVDVIDIANFEHLDFTYANNATESVNKPVLKFLNDGKPQC